MSKTCFVISPIGEPGSDARRQADQALKHLIKKALDSDFEVSRGDADENPGAITPRIISSIQGADLIVADMSGLNANVFYELAIAHGFNVPTVHLQRSTDKVPFDVKDMRVVRYDLNDPDELESAQELLKKYAAYAMTNPAKLETPLTSAGRFHAVEASTDPVTESNKQVLEAIEELAGSVRRALRTGQQSRRFTSLEQASEDNESLRRSLTAVKDRGALETGDLRDSITAATSTPHDDLMRELLGSIVGPRTKRQLNRHLFTAELWADSSGASDDDELDPVS
ncbi:hypothetical protein EDF51_10172 [Curtobacterium sp. PhB25]|uniref:hypothetical protein n=1 Tax=Curtobacterium sp. PhB25 TaxID=2485205 RepID=UPI001065D073|nr:hypothetical protein [Curtobacterium sp. PhB25]TDW74067.1 hypothetical protein EDF51_10172 [Curtobacterium sp. PhB25]